MTLEEKLEKLMISSQERSQFSENPDAFIKRKCEEYYKRNDERHDNLKKRWYETKKHFQKRLELFDNELAENYKRYCSSIKNLSKEALIPTYVYYKGSKIQVPDSFYRSFYSADVETYLEYLAEEDRKHNVITDEDREKARLLNCGVDYVFLQNLINKMNVNPDLVVTVTTKDGSVINIRKTSHEEVETITTNELFIEPQKVR